MQRTGNAGCRSKSLSPWPTCPTRSDRSWPKSVGARGGADRQRRMRVPQPGVRRAQPAHEDAVTGVRGRAHVPAPVATATLGSLPLRDSHYSDIDSTEPSAVVAELQAKAHGFGTAIHPRRAPDRLGPILFLQRRNATVGTIYTCSSLRRPACRRSAQPPRSRRVEPGPSVSRAQCRLGG